MKSCKTKFLFVVAIAVLFLVGTSYLLMPQLAKTERVVTTSAQQPEVNKPEEPTHQEPATVYTGVAQPEKVAAPPPTRYPRGVVKLEGGEDCATATVIGSLPFYDTGWTCDNVDDYDEACPYSGSTSPDVVYSYTPGSDEVINIDLYGSFYDTKVYVYENVCQSPYYACNDDYYPDYTSAILGLDIYAGNTYYIVVDGYGGDCGDYVLNITLYEECDVVCPPGGIPEDEPWCEDDWEDIWNGGCNSTPYAFNQTLNCGDTLCGTSGTYLYYGSNYRDTDWFRLVLADPTTLTFKCVAEFPLQTILIDAGSEDCVDYVILDYRQVNACDTATITMDVPPAVYWLWVGPSVFEGVDCGKEYVAIVDCEIVTTGACCQDDYPYECQELTQAECDALGAGYTFLGVGTNCDPNPCIGGNTCDNPIIVDLNKAAPGDTLYFDQNQTTCGRGDDYENTCLGYYDGGEDIIYQLNVTTAVTVDIIMDPKGTNWCGMAIDDACPPGDPCMAYVTGYSGPWALYGVDLNPGTYYIMVDTWPSPDCIPDFDLAIIESVGGPENDDCANATPVGEVTDLPFSTTMASFDGQGTCMYSANIWYLFTSPCTQNVTVSLCGSEYDTKLAIYDGSSCDPLSPEIDCNDDYCGLQSEITFAAVEGNQYLIEVGGYSNYTGDGVLNIYCVEPCILECPPGGIPEGEPDCYDGYVDNYNGGCNSDPYVFQNINCGDTICGTSGVYDYYGTLYRDTDWFRVQVSEGYLTWTCVAEFPLLIFIIDAGTEDCVDYTILGYTTVNPCDTATLSFYVPAGVYWLWVGPSDWGAYPCGELSEYVAWAECEPLGPQIAVTPGSFDPLLNPTGACSSATENLYISSVGGLDLVYEVTEDPPVAWMEVSPTSGTLPPGTTDTLDVSFDAGGMAPGDYYTDLVIASNATKQLPDTILVPVHLTVELTPDIDVPPRLWMPVIPGCMMDQTFRVDNLGEGELRFEVSVESSSPPAGAPQGTYEERILPQVRERYSATGMEDAPRLANKIDPAYLTDLEPGDPMMSPPGSPRKAEGDTLFIQIVHDPDESWSFATSDQGSGYKVYENFWDLPGGPIGDIHWWGMALIWTGFGWENGDPSNLVFDITFYSDPPDDPNLPPTEVACTYVDVVPSYVYYDLYAGYYNCYFFSFDTLDPSCDLVEGWVSIESKSPGEGYDWFLWGSAKTGDGMSCQEGGDCPRWYDQAFILTEGAPACPFTVTPEADTVPPGEYTDLLLTFDGTLFTECVDESMVCYLVITSNDCDEPVVTADVHATSARGDLNGDCLINIEDVVYLLNYIFVSGPAPTPECMADVDRDGDVDSDDALYLLSYLFTGGPPPDVPTAPKEGETIEMKTIRPIKQTPIQRK